jgi:hypothetical protein
MKLICHAFALLAAVTIVGTAAAPVLADVPGNHPYYSHALADLRFARALLENPADDAVAGDQHRAVYEIDHALYEIHQASIDDGKKLGDHPPIDVSRPRIDRVREAGHALDKARYDLSHEESNPGALGWRSRALRHINAALDRVNSALAQQR